ncbi:MAG: Na+/H+ antiporter NhaC family protein [Planctomycetota bacterium]|jgi:Na+/H+ antiporter NhaC
MTKTIARIAVAFVILAALCALAASFAPAETQDPQAAMWYSVIPPTLAIVLAFLTRRVLPSLGIAIAAGGLLNHVPRAPLSAAVWLEGFKTAGDHVTATLTDSTYQQILAFIPPIFVMIEILIASGGFKGIIAWLLRWIKGPKSAQAATAIMGILCFIDDYTNAIVVGSMMQPITDRFRISREKLAFIVDATSAPIAGLAVISTWIAFEVGLLSHIGGKLGIEKSGYSMFFDALGFRFYCLLMIGFVFTHILAGRDFGPMKAAQDKARAAEPPEDPPEPSSNIEHPESSIENRASRIKKGRAINALVPLAGLVLFHLTGLWLDGTAKLRDDMQQWQTENAAAATQDIQAKPVDIDTLSPASWIYWREVIGHAENTPLVLACASLFGLALALIFSQLFGRLSVRVIIQCFGRGIKRAMIPFVILIMAWSLKNSCDSLKTGEFLATILAGRVPAYLFPPILFLVASVTSFATGTSYGTMAILMPTAIPIAFAIDGQTYGLTTMISLGAVLDGAIFGDHCSPISDTTIMSSIASSCKLIDHVRTQLPYSLFVAALALLCAYVPSALGLAPRWSLLLAVAIMACFFVILSRLKR